MVVRDTKADAPLHRIGKDELKKAVRTLASAFSEDPSFKILGIPAKLLAKMFSMQIKLNLRRGDIVATSGQCEGVMVTCPGEVNNMRPWNLVRSGAIPEALGFIKLLTKKELRKMFEAIEEDRKRLAIGPYIYLSAIGIAKERQGSGIGSRLMKALVERAEREGKAIYLETQSERNVRFYEGFGFAVVKHAEFSEGLKLWEMVRRAG